MPRLSSLAWTVLALLLLAPPLEAQGTGQILGRVVDSGGAPIAGAVVAARSIADTTRVIGTTTAQSGSFLLRVSPGRYRVEISHLGHTPYAREVAISADSLRADLGTLQLAAAPVAIEGITVEGERSGVIIAPDRTIYNTKDMPALEGGVATDALRSVPELNVDLEGKVTLRGATPQIHINGPPTPMQGTRSSASCNSSPPTASSASR